MKRELALLLTLALALALLTSCELMAPAPTQRPSIGLPGEPAGTDEPTPTEAADPTVDQYGFTIFPEGNYLADPKFDTDEFLPDYDADLSFLQPLTSIGEVLCRTDDTIYINSSGSLIMYMDKATGISGPLCGKPECLHNDNSCNAYLSYGAFGLRVYDGKLYWLNQGGGLSSTIMQANLDGTGRETVATFQRSEYSSLANPFAVIHRGYVYYAYTIVEIVDKAATYRSVVQAIPVSGGEMVTVFERTGSGHVGIIPVGNELYIEIATENRSLAFYKWDSESRKGEHIADIDGPESRADDSGISTGKDGIITGGSGTGVTFTWNFWPVPGDGIYFVGFEAFSNTYSVWKYSFKSKEAEVLFPVGGRMNGFTKKYIITTDREFAYGYDYNGETVFAVPHGEYTFSVFMGADERFIYGFHYGADGYGCFFAVPVDGGDVLVID